LVILGGFLGVGWGGFSCDYSLPFFSLTIGMILSLRGQTLGEMGRDPPYDLCESLMVGWFVLRFLKVLNGVFPPLLPRNPFGFLLHPLYLAQTQGFPQRSRGTRTNRVSLSPFPPPLNESMFLRAAPRLFGGNSDGRLPLRLFSNPSPFPGRGEGKGVFPQKF